jgi:phospholipid/cholesterol/gamma-HCH transport system permease protein
MRVMAVNPYNYLVAPRIVAGVIMLPMLTCIFVLTGVATSFFIGIAIFDVDVGTFFEKMKWIVKTRHLVNGMEKGAIFGAVLTSIGCFKGFFAGGGAKGVGRATTEAVVISLVAILVTDFFMSYLQFEKVF